MKLIALLPVLSLGGCITATPAPLAGESIDAHCHLFNASDLTIVRFLREVVLHLPQKPLERTLSKVDDPDGLDVALAGLLNVAGASRAPNARDEIKVLSGRMQPEPQFASFEKARLRTEESVAEFIYRKGGRTGLATKGYRMRTDVDDGIYRMLLGGGGADIKQMKLMTRAEARRIAKQQLSVGDIKALFDWITLFTLYRHVLAERLAKDQTNQGRRPILLTPAMVDYDLWLGEKPDSSLEDQARVMSLISRRNAAPSAPRQPVVHGYFPFDPLRQVLYERRGRQGESPLDLVKRVLDDYGFIGVKLYPPMGFRPAKNVGPYPDRVKKLVPKPSADLDDALKRLYAMCVEMDAPILTHAYPSNAPFETLAERADPHYWMPVFDDYPTLRVCLAHFGGFDKISKSSEHLPYPQNLIEWAVGRHLKAHPETRVVADISFLSEILLTDNEGRKKLGQTFRDYLDTFDRDVEHLVFGTDWTMLGRLKEYSGYVQKLETYLKNDCGIEGERLERLFTGNAVRFLGLGANGQTRNRLLRYYRRHGLDETRLPSDGRSAIAALFR